MTFYERLAATATRLIESRGKPAVLIRSITSGPKHNPTTAETEYPVMLVETGYSLTNRNETLVQKGDKMGLISIAGEEPLPSDKIVIDEARYSFVDIEPLNPGGTVLLFEIQARK